jgi:hypothetical protein
MWQATIIDDQPAFEDFPNQDQLAVGNTVSVKGLLFNTPTTPTLVTRTIHDHMGD